MNNADKPVDRDPDADRRPLEPPPEADETAQWPAEPTDVMQWIGGEGGGYQEGGVIPDEPAQPDTRRPMEATDFSESEEDLSGGAEAKTGDAGADRIRVSSPAEFVGRGPAGPEPIDQTEHQKDSRTATEGTERIRVTSGAERVSETGRPTRGPKRPGGKRRLRTVTISLGVVMLAALGTVGYKSLPLAGKQGPGGNAEQANAGQVSSTPGEQPAGQQPPGQQPPAEQKAAPQPPGPQPPGPQPPGPQPPGPQSPGPQPPGEQKAGQQPPGPAAETVAGIELFDASRLTGPLSEKEKEVLQKLKKKITTDRDISQADLDRVTVWITSVGPDSAIREVKELLVIMRILNGDVAAAASSAEQNNRDAPSQGNKGASTRRPCDNAPRTSQARGWLLVLSEMRSAGVFFTFLAADEPPPPDAKTGQPKQPPADSPPAGLSQEEIRLWNQSQELVRSEDTSPLVRAAAYDALQQLCKKDAKRAAKYAEQARQIREETARQPRSPKERSVLQGQTQRQEQARARELTMQASADAKDAAKQAADAAGEAKKSVKDVQDLVTSAKSDVAALRKDLEAGQKLAKGQMPPGKTDAEARKEREAIQKATEEAKAQAIAAKSEADAARKDREAAQKSLDEAKTQAAAAKNDAQLAQKARREVQMGGGTVPADVVTKVELARAVEDLKKDASAARKSAEQISANLGQIQSQADEQRRSVADALKSLKEEVGKLAGGPIGKGITAEQLEKIVGEVANRVSAAAAQYDWQSPVALRGPLGRIRQWYYPPAPSNRMPQVAERATEAAPQAPSEGAGGTAPAQAPIQPAQPAASPPASTAAQQLVDAKLKSLGEPASQEPNPLLAGEIFSRGASAYFLGEAEEALDYFVAAIRQDPKNALYRYYLGLTLRRLGRPAEAEVQVRAGKRLESPTWRYGIGSSLQRVQGPDRDWLEKLRLEM